VTIYRSFFIAAALLVSACEKQTTPSTPPSETPPATDTNTTDAPADDGTSSFFTLDEQGKMQRMTKVVMPQMGEVFKAYDAEKYGKFDCATCHVNHAHKPKDGLPKIVLSNGGWEKLSAEKPELMKFMSEQVAPAMAKAMGEPPFDPATGKGFGCTGCHTVE
jgi:hypothetical protein